MPADWSVVSGDLEFKLFMKENHFTFLSDNQLVCTLCGSMIAGDMMSQWWELHRTRCIMPVEGKHKREM